MYIYIHTYIIYIRLPDASIPVLAVLLALLPTLLLRKVKRLPDASIPVLTHPDGEGIIRDPAARHYGSCPRSHEHSCCAGVGDGASVTNTTAGHEHR